MQNAQNTEIQQRVMNLVNLYRTKVGKESEVAKEAKEDYERWEEVNSRFAEEDFHHLYESCDLKHHWCEIIDN